MGMHIGICGARGSFSEMAAESYIAKNKVENANLTPLVTAENVLSAVEEGAVDIGIFPIENSNGGVVIESVHAMAAHTFVITQLFEIDVHHHLLVKPGTTKNAVTTITSHDQALKQCRHYLRRQWFDADIEEYPDTAKAAEDLANGTLSNTTAVIAPRRSAEIYGLEILEEAIQDLKYNYTMFVAAKKR